MIDKSKIARALRVEALGLTGEVAKDEYAGFLNQYVAMQLATMADEVEQGPDTLETILASLLSTLVLTSTCERLESLPAEELRAMMDEMNAIKSPSADRGAAV